MNNQIEIKPLDISYFDIAVEMAVENYLLERKSTNALYSGIDANYFAKQLEDLFLNGIGRVAFEDNRLIGFLAFDEPFTLNKSGVKGATSPLCGYGIRHNKRGEVIGKLFQDTAAALCLDYVQSLRVNVYAHDMEVLWTYIMSSFSMDVTDVVREVNMPIESKTFEDYSFAELEKKELIKYKSEIIELYRGLINHLRISPIFYHCRYFLPIENRFNDFLGDDIRVFAVFDGCRLVGIIDSEPTDSGVATVDTEALCMGDVFITPAYRGCGLAAALLRFANNELKKSGIKRLFVTHGTINPTARGFWDKYFTNYSYTMTRLIDADMLGIIKPF